MSLDRLDPVLTQPKRLAALGILAASNQVEFAFLRRALELSDSDLSKQMSTLVNAGYASARKTGRGADRRTWYRVTAAGRTALQEHLGALNALVNEAPSAPDPEHGQDPGPDPARTAAEPSSPGR